MTAENREHGIHAPLRHGDPRVRGSGDGRTHSGNNLETQSGRGKRETLLRTAREDKRIASLEAADTLPLFG